jgi:hypothetical protein
MSGIEGPVALRPAVDLGLTGKEQVNTEPHGCIRYATHSPRAASETVAFIGHDGGIHLAFSSAMERSAASLSVLAIS